MELNSESLRLLANRLYAATEEQVQAYNAIDGYTDAGRTERVLRFEQAIRNQREVAQEVINALWQLSQTPV